MKRTPLRARPPVDHSGEPGYWAWKTPTFGPCEACGKRGLRLRHHVMAEQHVRAAGGRPWDLANAMALGYYACDCHRAHHHATRRLPLSKVRAEAIAFAVELVGEAAAGGYMRRYYAAD